MIYRSLTQCLSDLEANGMLVRVKEEVDPHQEMAAVHRRVHAAGGPALLFTNVKGSAFPAVSNVFGTSERTRFLFRHTLKRVKRLIALRGDPMLGLRRPWSLFPAGLAAWQALPRPSFGGPALAMQTSLDKLPQIQAWPKDGGAYITLPQVYTEHPEYPGLFHSNLGMYRVQISGAAFQANREAGFHYQIQRGIGVHHHAAIARGEKLRVTIFVGGPPAHCLAAVMPLPEGVPELLFAGALAGRGFRYTRRKKWLLSSEADFCITGFIDPNRTLPEGPFGDHLGYYSLAHDFPVMEVERIYHRRDAVWPFTVVGRPPQEDASLAEIIHELAGPAIPSEIPGLHAVHAVEAAGVHPLLLALGSERYVPYEKRRPRELLTIANAVLGFGQLSLAKYLFLAAREDDPRLNVRRIEDFFRHVLERVNWEEDLHFQTRTTIDTLDYSGTGLNAGSKLVVVAAGPKRRELADRLPKELVSLPRGFSNPTVAMAGILVVAAPPFGAAFTARQDLRRFCDFHWDMQIFSGFPLVVLVDDSRFAAADLHTFLWVAFTRSNPAEDVEGMGSFIENKHWGCLGPLLIDARSKPHHAPPLEEDPESARRAEDLAGPGKSLHGIF